MPRSALLKIHYGPMDRRVDLFDEGEDQTEDQDSEKVFDVLYDADKADHLREEDLLPNEDEAGAGRPRNQSEKLEKMCGHFPRRHHRDHPRRGDHSSEEDDGPSKGEEESSEEDLGYQSRKYHRGGHRGGRREAAGRGGMDDFRSTSWRYG